MMEKYKNLITYNLKTLLLYEFIYLLFTSLLIVPASVFLYDFIKHNEIYSLSLFLIISLLFSLSIILLVFNKINLITIIDKSKHHKKISPKEIINISLTKLSKILTNYKAFILYLFFIPGLYFSFSLYLIINLYIYTNVDIKLLIGIVGLYLVLTGHLFKYIYSLYYFLIDEKNFKNSKISSTNLVNNNYIIDLKNILAIQIIGLLVLLLIVFIYRITVYYAISNIVIKNLVNCLVWLSIVLILTVYIIISNTIISGMFYHHKNKNKEKCSQIRSYKNYQIKLIPKTVVFVSIIYSVLFSSNYIYQSITTFSEDSINTEVTAHRGANKVYPENTMLAFKEAKKEKASWIEIDVRQTKDKKIVVFHDNNLSRITGVDKEVIDMTYAELKKLDYGSFFDKKYSNTKIPLLKDVVKFAKENDIKLNIELKITYKEIDFEKQVVDIVEKYDFIDSCVIEATTYKQIRKIKRLNPDIKTAYLTSSISNEDMIYLDDIDVISMEFLNVNSYLIDKIHKAGKEIYVWTLNDEKKMDEMIALNVDNIITDNIELANELIEKWKEKINDF